jgi:hypothetical protein
MGRRLVPVEKSNRLLIRPALRSYHNPPLGRPRNSDHACRRDYISLHLFYIPPPAVRIPWAPVYLAIERGQALCHLRFLIHRARRNPRLGVQRSCEMVARRWGIIRPLISGRTNTCFFLLVEVKPGPGSSRCLKSAQAAVGGPLCASGKSAQAAVGGPLYASGKSAQAAVGGPLYASGKSAQAAVGGPLYASGKCSRVESDL